MRIVFIVFYLLSEQFLEQISRFIFARIGAAPFEFAPDHFEPLAIIRHVLFGHGFGAPVLALVGDARVVMHAIEADFQVRATTVARFAASRLAGESELPAAFMTMTGHAGGS